MKGEYPLQFAFPLIVGEVLVVISRVGVLYPVSVRVVFPLHPLGNPVSEVLHDRATDYQTLVRVTIESGERTRRVAGTLIGEGKPRLVEIDGIPIEGEFGRNVLYTRNLDKPKAWLAEIGAAHLAYYADANAKVFQDLKAVGKAIGMPTTLLVDPNGCEIASLAGPAEWASPDGVKLITAAMGK